MEPTTNQIHSHIERTRDALGSNLDELEEKVKSATDWEQHFRNNPGTSLALAFGGGLLLAAMLGGRDRCSPQPCAPNVATGAGAMPMSSREGGAAHAWDNVKSAIIGVAANHLMGYAEDLFFSLRRKSERGTASSAAADAAAEQQSTSRIRTGNQNT
ncbi:MAG: hypothetical protein QM757_12685 [Paludibaculum sp.]